ncbi:type III pantothenate kinase [Endozoicomonas sp. Mp262]|uniref:type III pantothenate kinase n=1 Tax=Endozoicomonas sp. Mp262 TaxID=2919499 RepID=UPI0021DADBA6
MKSSREQKTNESILELDAGNTRLKWRVLRDGRVADAGYLINSDSWRVQLPVLLERLGTIDFARASVVSGSRRKELLASIISEGLGVDIKFASPVKRWKTLEVSYQEPGKLGVDRWLAMLAAHHEGGARVKLVVDCGTALTLDVVDARGRHLGGYIVPGLDMMKKSLQLNTAHLMLYEDPVATIAPGRATRDCINQGILSMAVSLINTQAKMYPGALVFLAGGDAGQVESYIESEKIFCPDLVMDGLKLAFD